MEAWVKIHQNTLIWAHKTSLNPPLFIQEPGTKWGKWAMKYLNVSGIKVVCLYDIYIWSWNCSDDVELLVFHCIDTNINAVFLWENVMKRNVYQTTRVKSGAKHHKKNHRDLYIDWNIDNAWAVGIIMLMTGRFL